MEVNFETGGIPITKFVIQKTKLLNWFRTNLSLLNQILF